MDYKQTIQPKFVKSTLKRFILQYEFCGLKCTKNHSNWCVIQNEVQGENRLLLYIWTGIHTHTQTYTDRMYLHSASKDIHMKYFKPSKNGFERKPHNKNSQETI